MAATTSNIYATTTSYNSGWGTSAICRTSDEYLHSIISYASGANKVIGHVDSTDEGVSWNLPDIVLSDNWTKTSPSIAADSNDDLHVAWVENRADASYDITYSKSDDGGATWDAPTILWDGSVLGGNAVYPSIAVDSNDDIYVICQRDVGGVFRIVMKIYTAAAWQAEEVVMSDTGNQSYCKLYIDSNDDVHCVWYGFIVGGGTNNPRYKKRTNGVGWGAVANLDTDATARPMSTIDLTVDSTGDIFVAWGAEDVTGRFQIQANRYTGAAWQGVETLTTGNQEHDYVAVSKDDTNVYVFYHDRTNTEIEYVMWNGIAWGAETNIASTVGPQNTIRCSCIDAGHPIYQNFPGTGFAMFYGHDPGDDTWVYYGSDGLTWTHTFLDTATLKDYALRLFAHRTIANATVMDNPEAAVVSYVRFFDSNSDYIQIPVCRNFTPDQVGDTARDNIFDDTGGDEADPEYTSVTQYYHDLNLAVFVPQFNKTYDVSANSWGYSDDPFTVADYKLYNAGGDVVAEAADTTIGFSIVTGTRYLLRVKIRVFNDMVEQSIGENTRATVTTTGLKTILRRMLHDNSPQDFGRPPMFVGVGGEGAYYIDNASDGRWRYDASATSYTATTNFLFPLPSAIGDAFAFCREETDSDQLEGIEFDINAPGVLSTGASLLWQYWNGSDWLNLTGVVDNTVDLDPTSSSYGSPLSIDGTVRWLAPPDIDVDAELKGGTVGCYYRCVLVGGGFSTNPTVIGKAYPLVYRTVQSETSMQQPFNRKTADIVGVPYTGNAAKVSAEFGIGSVPERYDSDGLLIAKAFVPTRETATFTTDGVMSEEDISIVEVTGLAVANGSVNIPTTNPEPLKILTVIDSGGGATDGELMPVAGQILTDDERAVSGANYVVTLKGVPDEDYDIKYLAKTITPSITPLNIISVTGNTQTLLGPQQVYVYASENNPADTDGGGDTKLNPKLIMRKGFPVGGDTGSTLLPNMDSQFGEGLLSSPTKFGFGNVTKKETPLTHVSGGILGAVGDAFGMEGTVTKYWAVDYVKMTAGYPLIMLRFNVSNYSDLSNPVLMVSMENSTIDGGTVGAFVWTTGDVKSQSAHDRETAWRSAGYTRSRSGDVNVNQNMALTLDLKLVENGDGTRTSPVIDDNGNIFVMLAPSNKEYKDGRITIRHDGKNRRLKEKDTAKIVTNLVAEGISRLGTLSLHYASLAFSPVKNLRDEIYNFRRGIDWKYVLGDATADWVKQSSDPDQFAVNTLDGTTYYPVLPSMLFWERTEKYFFTGANPSDTNTNINLYVKDMPVDTAGVYVWMNNEGTLVDTLNGRITVNSVSWNPVGIWNDIDYEDDHIAATTGGDGAGVINLDFSADYWHGTEVREVYVRYLAQTYPTLTMSYLVDRGLMFSRAHFSPLSFSPVVTPDYGDSLRIYFEVQFGHKRT